MKAIVLGATGMLGSYIHRYLRSKGHEVIGTHRCFGKDARNFENSDLGHACSGLDNDTFTVINCIGAIKQKYDDPQYLVDVNAIFPVNLAAYLKNNFKNAQMLHFSTDCVFNGDGSYLGVQDKKWVLDGYRENDQPTATDAYGQSKAMGENCWKQYGAKVIRTSIVGREFDTHVSLLSWVCSQNGGTIEGYTNHMWQGVTCLEAAKATESFMEHFEERPPLLHVHSPIPKSKYHLIEHIIDVYNLDIELVPVAAKTTIDRRLSSGYKAYTAPPILEQLYEQALFDQSPIIF